MKLAVIARYAAARAGGVFIDSEGMKAFQETMQLVEKSLAHPSDIDVESARALRALREQQDADIQNMSHDDLEQAFLDILGPRETE